MEHRRTSMIVLIAAATVAAAAACASSGIKPTTPTATQAVTATQAAAPQEFVSTRYHFRVTLTKDWSEADAFVDWDGKELQGVGSPEFANFVDPLGGRALVVGAAPVAKGMQLAEWKTAMVRAAPDVCSDSSSEEKTTLGGDPALAWTSTCSDGGDVNKLAALHGNLGYMFFVPSNTENDNAVDLRIFNSIRGSFRFTN
jgi:hypothetical protein